ncbi:hypothetical protein B7486_54495, partial [cyanobacterium TDX16]
GSPGRGSGRAARGLIVAAAAACRPAHRRPWRGGGAASAPRRGAARAPACTRARVRVLLPIWAESPRRLLSPTTHRADVEEVSIGAGAPRTVEEGASTEESQ